MADLGTEHFFIQLASRVIFFSHVVYDQKVIDALRYSKESRYKRSVGAFISASVPELGI
jgi:hypothetical protein